MQDIIKSIFLLAFQIIRAFSNLFNISLFEKKENGRDKFLYRDNKILDKKHTFVLDASAMIARSFDNFPVRPERLIERAKEVISVDFGVKDPDVLAEEFEFIFPVIGPLKKTEFLRQVSSFNLDTIFPNHKNGMYFAFFVDPYETNRVWFMSALSCIHSGQPEAYSVNLFGRPTGKVICCPPQMCSLIFNENQEVVQFTGGYVVDKNVGNTGGLGGVFGILYALGRGFGFPEAQPYKPSFRFRLFTFIGTLINLLPNMDDLYGSLGNTKIKEIKEIEKPIKKNKETAAAVAAVGN